MASSPNSSMPSSPALLFYDSIINNNLEQLRKMVEVYKFDLNAKFSEVRRSNHKDLCPVHLVSFKGYFSILHYLIQSGVDVNQNTSTLYRQPLHHAAMSHQLSCSQLLINAGGYIDAKDTFGNTPLHYAAEDGENNLLTLLLQNSATPDSQDITHKTPLMKATRSGRIGTVKRLLACGCNVNLKDKNEDTALHFAARQGSADLIQMLLKSDARIDAQNQWGLTPLMEAVSYSQHMIVTILIRHKCDLYKRDYRTGDTALHIAVRKNYVNLVQALLVAGKWYVEYNFNNFGESFVHDAVVYNRWELVKLFLEHNYNFDYPAKRLATGCVKSPLQLAVDRGHLEVAVILSRVTCTNCWTTLTTGTTATNQSVRQDTQTGNVDNSNNRNDGFSGNQESIYGNQALNSGNQVNDSSNHINNNQSNNRARNVNSNRHITPNQTSPTSNNMATNNNNNGNAIVIVGNIISQKRAADLLELEQIKTLKQWCRKVIRKSIGFHINDKITQIGLPPPLVDFILLSDIQWNYSR